MKPEKGAVLELGSQTASLEYEVFTPSWKNQWGLASVDRGDVQAEGQEMLIREWSELGAPGREKEASAGGVGVGDQEGLTCLRPRKTWPHSEWHFLRALPSSGTEDEVNQMPLGFRELTIKYRWHSQPGHVTRSWGHRGQARPAFLPRKPSAHPGAAPHQTAGSARAGGGGVFLGRPCIPSGRNSVRCVLSRHPGSTRRTRRGCQDHDVLGITTVSLSGRDSGRSTL